MRTKTLKLRNKSGKCKCEICKEICILETHHLRGKDIPSPNHPSNLASLCPNCHSKVHYDMIIIEGWASTTDGKELLWHKKGVDGITGDDAKPNLLV